jgi:hypothetical protein
MSRAEPNQVREFLAILAAQAEAALSGFDKPGVLQLCRPHPVGGHLHVLRVWGFGSVGHFTCVKDIIVLDAASDTGMLRSGQHLEVVGVAGTGFWNRDRDEIMLIGTRGNVVCPAPETQGESVWFARRGEHSVKPDCCYEWFERHWPNTPKIELHSRRARRGWKRWGPEAPHDDEGAP